MDISPWVAAMNQVVGRFTSTASDYLPSLVGALVVLVVGWLLARLFSAVAARLVRGFDSFLQGSRFGTSLNQATGGRDAAAVIGGIVFWSLFLFFIAVATEMLGLAVATTFLTGLSHYLPSVLAAVLIVIAGLLFGQLARRTIGGASTAANIAYAELLGRVSQAVIILIAFVVAVDQIGIEVDFLVILIAIVTATVFGAMAVAFGLGAKTAVSNIIGCHYLAQTYRVGQTVQIGEIKGRIVKIAPTAVVLETQTGQALIPAKAFIETPSILIAGEG